MREEVDRFKMRVSTEESACKLEEKARESNNRVLVKQCVIEKENDKGEGREG